MHAFRLPVTLTTGKPPSSANLPPPEWWQLGLQPPLPHWSRPFRCTYKKGRFYSGAAKRLYRLNN